MPNGLLILFAFALYGLFVYGPDLERHIGRKRKIVGKPFKAPIPYTFRSSNKPLKEYKVIVADRYNGVITIEGNPEPGESFMLDSSDYMEQLRRDCEGGIETLRRKR